MRRAAIGIRAHSGWGALVAVCGGRGALEVIDRRRVDLTDGKMAGAQQPYHFVQEMKLADAERHISECAAVSKRMAIEGLRQALDRVARRECSPAGCAILLAAGHDLPPLPGILTSHSLIHTAEGEFFRRAFRTACERLRLPVEGIRERELFARTESAFGEAAEDARREIADLCKALGPPWTTDQKTAALAALLILESGAAAGGAP
jgi:hypothetical protein